MDQKIKKTVGTIFITIVVVLSFALAAPFEKTYALIVEGERYGLRVSLSEELVSTDNLNPGDVKQSAMTISNQGSYSLPVYLSWEITQQVLGQKAANLGDRLWLKVQGAEGSQTVFYDQLINRLAERIHIVTLGPGESYRLLFTVSLPGQEVSNDYQATSITVQWKIQTDYRPPDNGGGEEEEDDDGDWDDEEEIEEVEETDETEETDEIEEVDEQEEEEDVTGEQEETETDELIEIIDGETPEGTPEETPAADEPEAITEGEAETAGLPDETVPLAGVLPKTGEVTPYLFYGSGGLLILIGLWLSVKRKFTPRIK